MSKRMTGWALILTATFIAVPSLAADVSLSKDLMAVIALQGLPCGQVVSVKRQGDKLHRIVRGREPLPCIC
jgi:hypothetical protein